MINPDDFVDLTHILNEDVPTWTGSKDFECKMICDYAEAGYRLQEFKIHKAGVGTHFDAPCHFIPGGRSVSDYQSHELIAPACVIDISESVKRNPDYQLTQGDVLHWEDRYGLISPKSLVLAYTGWSALWKNPKAYLGMDEKGVRHFPGFSAAAAHLLLERNVIGLGIDTLSPDPGNTTTFDVHHIMLGADRYLVENLCNLERLPPTGSWIFVMPMKIENGTEAPARVIAQTLYK